MMGYALDQYRQSAIASSSPAGLIRMLLQKAVAETRLGVKEMEEGLSGGTRLHKAQEIVAYLRSILDREKGGNLAVSLDALYDFVYWRLGQGWLERSPDKVREGLDILVQLKEAWEEARA
ncbi:MAG: flagellar export chaperone FliS [Bacillota bacterium]|nr:flagellar export chaperone FliS [Bacillota bacterium]